MPVLSPEMKAVNMKQRKFVREYVDHGNITDAAAEAFNHKTRQSAAAHGSQLLKKKDIRQAILKKMEEKNITVDYLLENRKKLIDKGVEGLDDSKVSPELLNKALEQMTGMYITLGDGLNNKTNSQVHLHLHEAPRSEVIAKSKENRAFFDAIEAEEPL